MKYLFELSLWHASGQQDGQGERLVPRLGRVSKDNPGPTPELPAVKGLEIQYPSQTMDAAVVGALLTDWAQRQISEGGDNYCHFVLALVGSVATDGFLGHDADVTTITNRIVREYDSKASGRFFGVMLRMESFRRGLDDLLLSVYRHCYQVGEAR